MVYKWYILPIEGLYATYHLLREPETTIDHMMSITFHHKTLADLKSMHYVFTWDLLYILCAYFNENPLMP